MGLPVPIKLSVSVFCLCLVVTWTWVDDHHIIIGFGLIIRKVKSHGKIAVVFFYSRTIYCYSVFHYNFFKIIFVDFIFNIKIIKNLTLRFFFLFTLSFYEISVVCRFVEVIQVAPWMSCVFLIELDFFIVYFFIYCLKNSLREKILLNFTK
jgi:hypothetical protein